MTDILEGHDMDIQHPGWWSFALAAGGAITGFIWRSAIDRQTIKQLLDAQSDLKSRLSALENGSVTTATALATLSAQNESIGRTLARIEGRLDRFEGRER
jgi:hypothetical protein